jgi:hypothetical protein
MEVKSMNDEQKIEFWNSYFSGLVVDLFTITKEWFEKLSEEGDGGETVACNHIISGLERVKAEWFHNFSRYSLKDDLEDYEAEEEKEETIPVQVKLNEDD